MSERSREPGPRSSSIPSGDNQRSAQRPPLATAPSSYHISGSTATTPSSTSPIAQRNERSFELPPLSLPQALPASGNRPSPAPRSVGVSSILNPAVEPDEPHGRRRKASQLEPHFTSAPLLPSLQATSQPFQMPSGPPSTVSTSGHGAVADRPPRRILTPRSPSLHRAASLGHLNPSSATFSAQHTPFPGSPRHRSYAIEPGTAGAPPLPTPPAASRHHYGYPAPTPPIQSGRRASISAIRGMRHASESTSPRSSYSGYSQAEQNSPAPRTVTSAMPTLSASYHESTPGNPGMGNSSTSMGSDRQRVVGVPISSSVGQNVYQMMTLETTSGTVQLPVDVQAASRVADEKRRRNAGASARFRQRRKEKEKEASTTISRLEQQLKEIGEDMDFYKRERDYLAGVVLQVPGGERHFPRPPSPRQQRNGSNPTHGGNAGFVPIQEQAARSPDEGRNVRRRTSTLSLPAHGQNASTMATPTQGFPPPYNPQVHPHTLAPQLQQHPPNRSHHAVPRLPSPIGRGSLPPPQPQSGPPQLMQAPPQTGPWNPYAERRAPGDQGRGGR